MNSKPIPELAPVMRIYFPTKESVLGSAGRAELTSKKSMVDIQGF